MADLAAVACAVLLCLLVALGVYCLRLAAELRKQAQLIAELDAENHRHLREIHKRLDAYLAGSIGMGEELRDLTKVVMPLSDKLSKIELRDPVSVSFTQAARLVGLGATADDIAQSCGLSRGEAELVSRLNKLRKSQD